MVNVQILEKPAFTVVGKKTWISGQDNDQFAQFWDECHQNGLVERAKTLSNLGANSVTQAAIIGVSRVEKDPNNRAFDFYIGAETERAGEAPDLEHFTIPATTWAVFCATGETLPALIEAEMYAFMEWMPKAAYTHAFAPEMEVYPPDGNVQFWLPLQAK